MRLLKALGWEINPPPLPPSGYDSFPVGAFSTIPLRDRAAGIETTDHALLDCDLPFCEYSQRNKCCQFVSVTSYLTLYLSKLLKILPL